MPAIGDAITYRGRRYVCVEAVTRYINLQYKHSVLSTWHTQCAHEECQETVVCLFPENFPCDGVYGLSIHCPQHAVRRTQTLHDPSVSRVCVVACDWLARYAAKCNRPVSGLEFFEGVRFNYGVMPSAVKRVLGAYARTERGRKTMIDAIIETAVSLKKLTSARIDKQYRYSPGENAKLTLTAPE